MKHGICVAIIVFICLQLATTAVCGQVTLKPSIGLSSIPGDGDTICDIPLAIDPGNIFLEPGLHEGDTIPDFKLYTLANDSVQISELLADGKPVLLVGGSYTCPKYRNRLDQLADLQSTYADQVHIFIVYTVEAHPDSPDISPYKGEIWELNSNDQLGIHFHEPVTYLDRKTAAGDMLNDLEIPVPVLLDGPCNKWWETFALAPNPAFLIRPTGVIFLKQGWFENNLHAVSNAIDSLLQDVGTAVREIKNTLIVINDPFSDFARFSFTKPPAYFRFELGDMMGRTVETSSAIFGNQFILDKHELVPGVYLYAIYTGNEMMSGKLIIQ